jgi:hypothetical protein
MFYSASISGVSSSSRMPARVSFEDGRNDQPIVYRDSYAYVYALVKLERSVPAGAVGTRMIA